MKWVNAVHRPDGRVHYYLRKKGLPAVRLPDGLAADELARHAAELVRRLEAQRAAPGTLRAAIRAYELECPDFRVLAASTKYEYRLLMRELDGDLGHLAVGAFTPAVVNRLKGLWARRGHRAANLRLQVLRNVLKPALISGALAADPFPLVGQVRRPRSLGEPHLIWPDEVVRTVIEAALERDRHGLARAVAIARYVGARRGDLVAIPRSARQDGRFRYMSGKRRVLVDAPEDPQLTWWLSRTPEAPPRRAGRGGRVARGWAAAPATLVYNTAGRPYTEDGLGQELAKLVRGLKAQGRLDSDGYDLHGLRHTRGVELALAGCSDAQGAAMMGHSGPSSFQQYRRQADRVRLSDAAAARLAMLRERAGNARCAVALPESATGSFSQTHARLDSRAGSVACDGTAPPDRTGDLQSHNLAL